MHIELSLNAGRFIASIVLTPTQWSLARSVTGYDVIVKVGPIQFQVFNKDKYTTDVLKVFDKLKLKLNVASSNVPAAGPSTQQAPIKVPNHELN